MDQSSRSVTTLPEQVAALSEEERGRFEGIFSVVRSRGGLVAPPEMQAWIERSFGSLEAVQAQVVVKTLNKWTLEGSLFNSLRAQRNKARLEIGQKFPAYADLVSPRPPTVDQIRTTLVEGEAVVSSLPKP